MKKNGTFGNLCADHFGVGYSWEVGFWLPPEHGVGLWRFTLVRFLPDRRRNVTVVVVFKESRSAVSVGYLS